MTLYYNVIYTPRSHEFWHWRVVHFLILDILRCMSELAYGECDVTPVYVAQLLQGIGCFAVQTGFITRLHALCRDCLHSPSGMSVRAESQVHFQMQQKEYNVYIQRHRPNYFNNFA